MIKVYTLGKFMVSSESGNLDDIHLRSDTLKKLLLYIVFHRKKTIGLYEVQDVLWENEELESPSRALNNLIYRLRNSLSQTLGNNKYILTGKGTYCWNSEIEVIIDAEEFEEACKKTKEVSSLEERIALCELALSYYHGNFLEGLEENHWSNSLSLYYCSLYLDVVKRLCKAYLETKRYHDLELLCVDLEHHDIVDEEMYYYHVISLIREHKYELAVKEYEEAINVLKKTYGTGTSRKIQSAYEELLTNKRCDEPKTVEEIFRDLEEGEEKGAFICGYPVFREIYHLEVRRQSRLSSSSLILAVSLWIKKEFDFCKEQTKSYLIKQGMNSLEKSLKAVLRKGDVLSKYSNSQYIILLTSCGEQEINKIKERIIKKMEGSTITEKIEVNVQMKRINE